MHVLSSLALVGISAVLSTPVNARAGPFCMVPPIIITTTATETTQVTAASATTTVTAVHLQPTVVPTGGASTYHNSSIPNNIATITVTNKPAATPSTATTYDNGDQPHNPGYICRRDYTQCYARVPHPPDDEYTKALEANDQVALEAHEKKSTLATANDDACHADFKICLGFGLGPVLPRSNINPRQRKGQEKHTLPPPEQDEGAARIAADFKYKTIPVDAPSVRKNNVLTEDKLVELGVGLVVPLSEGKLESRAQPAEKELAVDAPGLEDLDSGRTGLVYPISDEKLEPRAQLTGNELPIDAPSVRKRNALPEDQLEQLDLDRIPWPPGDEKLNPRAFWPLSGEKLNPHPFWPLSGERLDPRAEPAGEEKKAHHKGFGIRFGKNPVRAGPMGTGPILPRDELLETKEEPIHPGRIHDKPTLPRRAAIPPPGPASGHAQGDPWRTAPKPTTLAKRQAPFRPNDLPPMWEDLMHGPFDVEDVVFGKGKMLPPLRKRSAFSVLPSTPSTLSTLATPSTTLPSTLPSPLPIATTLLPRDETDDETLSQKDYDDLSAEAEHQEPKGGRKEG